MIYIWDSSRGSFQEGGGPLRDEVVTKLRDSHLPPSVTTEIRETTTITWRQNKFVTKGVGVLIDKRPRSVGTDRSGGQGHLFGLQTSSGLRLVPLCTSSVDLVKTLKTLYKRRDYSFRSEHFCRKT